eukprot:1611998-Amphidinium_carterae.2
MLTRKCLAELSRHAREHHVCWRPEGIEAAEGLMCTQLLVKTERRRRTLHMLEVNEIECVAQIAARKMP